MLHRICPLSVGEEGVNDSEKGLFDSPSGKDETAQPSARLDEDNLEALRNSAASKSSSSKEPNSPLEGQFTSTENSSSLNQRELYKKGMKMQEVYYYFVYT